MSAPLFFIMKLQILIPQYKETDDMIRPLLDSIALQQSVDFNEIGVIIFNDGSDTYISKELIQQYPYHIECWSGPHKGVSGTRNSLLDAASADYVMWCDADDTFLSVCGLYLVFRHIEIGFDALNSLFFEETRDEKTNKPVYVKRENDATFVHGKVYRRQFLIENELRWNENLKVHEDCYFNGLAMNIAESVRYCEDPFYLWKWRDDSVCRNDDEYRYSTFVDLIDAYEALVSELYMRGYEEKTAYFVCYAVFETYYAMNIPSWIWHDEYRRKTEKRFAEFFSKWNGIWETTSMSDKMKIAARSREKALKEGLKFEAITLQDWLKEITTCQAEEQEKDAAGKK